MGLMAPAPPRRRPLERRIRSIWLVAVAEVPFDLAGGQARRAAARPGTVAKADVIAQLCAVALPVRDRGRARRVRQDNAARAVGRGRSASVRLGRARRRETTTPWCSCGTSPPRSTASSRSRPRCSTRCPARRTPPGRSASRASGARWPRSSTRWCWCSTTCTPSPTRPVWTSSRRCSGTFRPARRSRSQAARSRHCRSRAGGRRECTRSGWRTCGSTSTRPGCCSTRPASSSTPSELSELTERTKVARRAVPRGAVATGGRDERWAPQLHRRRPVRLGVLPPRAPLPAARRRGAVPHVHLGAGSHVAAVSATPCSRRRGRHETLERLERTNGFVVPLDRRGEWYRYHHLFGQLLRNELERSEPDLVPALNRRAMAWCIANELRRRRSPTGRPRARRTPSPAWSTALALPLYYDGRHGDRRRSGSGGSVKTSSRGIPALAVYGAWLRVLTGRPRRPSGGSLSPTGRPRQSRSRTAAPRSSPGSPPCGRT